MPKQVRATTKAQRERWMRDPETILADVQAAMTPQRKRTDPRPVHVTKAVQEGYYERLWKRHQAAVQASVDRAKARRAAKRKAIPSILDAMASGEWYGLYALARAQGVARNSVAWLVRKYRKDGWVERAANPAWDPKQLPPREIMAGAIREPKWLYRITEEGMKKRGIGAPLQG